MAGRGTDIMLGGNPEFRAVAALKQRGLDPEETPEEYEAAWDEALASRREGRRQPSTTRSPSSVASTSSAPSGTSRAASTTSCAAAPAVRVTRASRRFYLSLQDDLMRLFNAAMVDRFMTTASMEDDVPIESKMVSRSIQSAQSPGRGAELRDPQERPQVRRRAQPPAPGHLRRAPPGARGRGPARADPPLRQRRRRRLRRRPPPPTASPRTGTSSSSGPR